MKKLLLIVCVLTTLAFTGKADILPVPSMYITIQDAIDAAWAGDTVLVDPGTYYEHLNLYGQNITLCSKYLTTGNTSYISSTIIDGTNNGRVITVNSGEDTTCLISGFTVRNGNSTFETGSTYGGGILIDYSSPVVEHCVIENNVAPAFGGGLAITGDYLAPLVRNCTIRNNTADSFGGGVFMGDCSPGAAIVNSVITGNTITCACNFNGGGGGVNLYHRGKLINCLITNNSAPNSLVGGGGVYCDWGDYYGSQGIFVIGTTIANNSALYDGGVSHVITGGEFQNCILWGNMDGNNNVANYNGNTFSYSCSDPLPAGVGNISSDPLFNSPTTGDFHLTASSSCINTGNGNFNSEQTDLDGNPRINGIIDMGPYEYGSLAGYTVQVGDGTNNNDLFPIASCYDYNYSQQLYLGSEISSGGGLPGYINKIRFYYYGGSYNTQTWNQWSVYLGNTIKNDYLDESDWIPADSMTLVFTGTLPTPVGGSWYEITFNAPFYYTGNNLVVAVDENAPGWDCSAMWASFDVPDLRGLIYTSSWDNPDPQSPPDANWYPSNTIPQIQFGFILGMGLLEGYVYRATNCTTAVAGATVSAGMFSATTNSIGYYSLPLPSGTYLNVVATDDTVSQTISPVIIASGDTTSLDFCLPIYFAPPVQLEAEVTGSAFNNVNLTWLEPGSVPDQWLFWGNETLAGSLGYGNSAMTFQVAFRFPVADIAPYAGTYLKKIRIFPAEATASYSLKVWKGANAGTLLYSQPVANLNINTMNDIALITPVFIDGTDEFWFGYEINQTEGYPAGLSSGPAIAGKGDMINAGYGWISMNNSWNFNFNWLLQGFVSESPVPLQSVFPMIPEPVISAATRQDANPAIKPMLLLTGPGNMLMGETDGQKNEPSATFIQPIKNPANAGALVGYSVFRDNILLADSIQDLFYNDPALPKGLYSYEVTAQYEFGVSAPAGPVQVAIYTCFPPTGLTVSNSSLTTTSAEISWTPSTISSSTDWILEWGPVGFTPGTGTSVPVSGDTLYLLSGLNPGQEYDVYLTTVCTGADSSARVKKTFRTHYFDCFPGAIPEMESCGDTINNGCRLQSPSFSTINCGDTICGSAWLAGQHRDTDWYSLILTDTTDVTLVTKAEFYFNAGIKTSQCPSNGFITSTYINPGYFNQQTAQLIPGTYYIFMAPSFSGNVVCDSLSRYHLSLSCSDCLTPVALGAVNTGPGVAQLTWTSGAAEWEIEWGPAGFGQGYGTLITGITQRPYTLTGLTDGHMYQFYVRSHCDSLEYSNWAGPYTFFLPCATSGLPYYDDFTNDPLYMAPECWEVRGDGGPMNWILEDNSMAGGEAPELSFVPWANYYNGTSRLISPLIDTRGTLDLTLSFDQYREISNSNTSLEVMTTSDGGNSWNTVWSTNDTGIPGPEQITIYISNSDVGSATFQFAFAVTGYSWDINLWRIDDVSLDGYIYYGSLEGYVTDCSTGNPLEGANVVAGLQSTQSIAGGYYQFTSIPVGTYSVWFTNTGYQDTVVTGVLIEDGFTTFLDACMQPTGPPQHDTLRNITISSGQTVCYDATETITVAGGGTTFTVNNGGSVTMIAGSRISYLPGTTVQAGGYMLGKIAAGGPFCDALPPPSFLSSTKEPEHDAGAGFSVYPNPTTGTFRVDLKEHAGGSPVQIELYGMLGNVLYSGTMESAPSFELSLEGQPSGIYVIRLMQGGSISTKRIIKVK